jgi:hypothetical protein
MNTKVNNRTHSIVKPIFYLILQIGILWEIFWVLTGTINIDKWCYLEIVAFCAVICYLCVWTYKIIYRTPKKCEWSDRSDVEKFLK